jgi:hypothetical protein
METVDWYQAHYISRAHQEQQNREVTLVVPRGTIVVTIDTEQGSQDLYQLLYEYRRMFFLMTGKAIVKGNVFIGTNISKAVMDSLQVRMLPTAYKDVALKQLRLFDIEWTIVRLLYPEHLNHIIIADTETR